MACHPVHSNPNPEHLIRFGVVRKSSERGNLRTRGTVQKTDDRLRGVGGMIGGCGRANARVLTRDSATTTQHDGQSRKGGHRKSWQSDGTVVLDGESQTTRRDGCRIMALEDAIDGEQGI